MEKLFIIKQYKVEFWIFAVLLHCSLMERLPGRTNYKLANNNCKNKSISNVKNKYQITNSVFPCLRRHKMGPYTSLVSHDLKSVIVNTFFPNLSRDFLTNIDWLVQPNGSLVSFNWFINPTFSPVFKFCLISLIVTGSHYITIYVTMCVTISRYNIMSVNWCCCF